MHPDSPQQHRAHPKPLPLDMYTCPCCGYEVFDEPPGSYDICPICFWEDDALQLYFPLTGGGANRLSLAAAQIAYVQLGACEPRMVKNVRAPTTADRKDPVWFPLWEKRVELPDKEGTWSPPSARTVAQLCYWLRS